MFIIGFISFVISAAFSLFKVASTSMAPQLCNGDWLLTLNSGGREYERGDIIVFKNDGILTVKRVRAVEGDYVLFYGNDVIVIKGDECKGSCAANIKKDLRYSGTYITKKHFFVVGDNMARSEDSRAFGLVNYDDVVGLVIIELKGGRHCSLNSKEIIYED